MSRQKGIKGYKAFVSNSNGGLRCRSFDYEIGETYEMPEDKIEICASGFHFCKTILDCYNYYPVNYRTRICEIRALGKIIEGENGKFVTNKIKICKEIKNPKEKSNIGINNTGYCNKGMRNSGDFNEGYRNTGDHNRFNKNSGDFNYGFANSGTSNYGDTNSGFHNKGNRNTGHGNIGDSNSGQNNIGDRNTDSYNYGDGNSGHHNMGNWNTGCYNKGNRNTGWFNNGTRNTGVFNTECNEKIKMFNKDSDWTLADFLNSKAYNYILRYIPYEFSLYKDIYQMTDEEKESYPYSTITRGILLEKDQKNIQSEVQKWWDDFYKENEFSYLYPSGINPKLYVISLPNFDRDIFKECTGIEISDKEYDELVKMRAEIQDTKKFSNIENEENKY